MELRGKAALVTGGGTGLGRAISVALAEQGMSVAANYARSAREAEATAAELGRLGVDALAVQADVSDEAAVRAMIAAVIARFGRLDVLINNAAVTRYVPIPDVDAVQGEDFDRI